QYPEPATERGNYQVVAMHHHVAHGAGRHVQLERLPVAAVIEGDRHVALGGGVEQAAARGIFAYAVEVGGLGETIYGERPRLSVIARAVQVRQVVIQTVAIHGGVGPGGVEKGGFASRDAAPPRETVWCDVI